MYELYRTESIKIKQTLLLEFEWFGVVRVNLFSSSFLFFFIERCLKHKTTVDWARNKDPIPTYFSVKCTPPLNPLENIPFPLPPARIWAFKTISLASVRSKNTSENKRQTDGRRGEKGQNKEHFVLKIRGIIMYSKIFHILHLFIFLYKQIKPKLITKNANWKKTSGDVCMVLYVFVFSVWFWIFRPRKKSWNKRFVWKNKSTQKKKITKHTLNL